MGSYLELTVVASGTLKTVVLLLVRRANIEVSKVCTKCTLTPIAASVYDCENRSLKAQ